MTETSGNVMGISQYNKRENMAQLGNMVRPGKSQNNVKSSLPDAMKPVLSAEETTELSDVITREPKDVRMSYHFIFLSTLVVFYLHRYTLFSKSILLCYPKFQ